MSSPPDLQTQPFKDRKAGLVIFGILTILTGGLCALFVPLMFVGQTLNAQHGIPQNNTPIVPAMMMYATMAVVLIWIGIGSIMCRRWARALLLIFSWGWLIMGVIAVATLVFVLPKIFDAVSSAPPGQPQIPEAGKSVMMAILMVVYGVIFIILPGIWVLFYGSKHVKATCEANDPVVRWTDRCPLPVIAISVMLAFSAPWMLVMPIIYKGVFPFFGEFVTGPTGSAIYFLIAILWGYTAWALYKLDRRGWWIIVASMLLFSVSAVMTYTRHDLSELYTLMGYPPEQIALVQKMGFANGKTIAYWMVGSMIPFLGYLLYIRRFFPKED